MRAIAAIVSLATAVLAGGCASVDPTDPSHYTEVEIRNNTPASVVIVQCDTSCDVLHERRTVDSGQATIVSVSHEGITVGYVVEEPSGSRLGCLYMLVSPAAQAPVVDVSSLTRCH